MSFDLTQKIKVVNPTSNIDELYGPYTSVANALTGVPVVLRQLGRTVGIIEGGTIKEYWFENGITNSDLVPKGGGGTNNQLTKIPDWIEGTYPKDKIIAHNGGIWRSEIDNNNEEPTQCENTVPLYEELTPFTVDRHIVNTNGSEQYDFSNKILYDDVAIEYWTGGSSDPVGIAVSVGDIVSYTLAGGFTVIGRVLLEITGTETFSEIQNNHLDVEYVTIPFNNEILTGIPCDIILLNALSNQIGLDVPFIKSTETTIEQVIDCVLDCPWTLLAQVNESSGGVTNNSDTIVKTIEANLTDLGVMTEEEVTPQIIADYFNSLGLVKSEKDFYIIKLITEPIFNFDVTGNWNLTTDGYGNYSPITDALSFKTWLESGWTPEQFNSPNSFTDVVVSDFSLVGGRLTANVTTSGGNYFALDGLEITQVNLVSIGDFTSLGLAYNQLTDFNPTLPLPSGLENLHLYDNQLTDFNPTIALPTGLQYLELYNNQLTDFNPTLPLPSGLQLLDLSYNQIVDWSLSEPWANSLPTGTTNIGTQNNPTSSNGTTFKSILTGKGYNIIS